MKNKSSGFIQLIALIIVFVVIVLIIGKNPMEVWSEFVKPLFLSVIAFIVSAIEFLINIITKAWQEGR